MAVAPWMPKLQTQSGDLPPELASLAAELYHKSGGQELGLPATQFSAILYGIAVKYLPADSTEKDQRALLSSLRVEDLALAHACAAGHERAWEVFLTRFRAKLYEVAAYITRESSAARELADSLYADLYGVNTRDGERVSKLASYTGRGSLEGWLRTVLAQEYVNRYRKQRKLVSLDEESEEGVQFAAPEAAPLPNGSTQVEIVVDEVLAALPSEDRFILAAYFLDDHTLAQIARTLRVHESTISRKLNKLAKSLRKNILSGLVRGGMSRRMAEEAMETDVRDLTVNIRRSLAQETPVAAFPKNKAGVEDPQ
jgi:RNA polymerase sigma-70 factor (ECF subfamily)